MAADNGNWPWAWQNWTPGTCYLPSAPAGPVMGWTCPACGSSYSPSALKCWVCPQQPAATAGTSEPAPDAPTCCSTGVCREEGAGERESAPGRLTVAPVTPGDIAYLLLPPGAGFPPSAFSRLESALGDAAAECGLGQKVVVLPPAAEVRW